MNDQCRVGIGYDIHRLVEGRRLILGGVEIPFTHGLLGHSDGDSLSHAITDALLGAAGLGDIGVHFPDTDQRWAGADSADFLRHASQLIAARGLHILNIDATIMAERPKMRPYIGSMQSKLAETLQIESTSINIKAKTNEGLDAIGRGEAIGAQALVLLACRSAR